jgi:hypothetical protein
MNDTHSLSPRNLRPSPFRMLRLAPLALIGIAVLGAGAGGCSVTPDNPGPSCATDDTVACTDGVGYSCLGSDAPDDSDSSLLCSDGTAGNAGSTLYCCLHAVHGTSCSPDDTVAGCAPGSFGFSCSDATEPPNDSYPSLQCSAPTPGNAGSAIYCCTD